MNGYYNFMDQKPTRKDREKQRHREEILHAAEAIFAEKGFYGTTMDDIANRAEFAMGTLYAFFPSKEQLYQTLINERFQEMASELLAAMAQTPDPLECLRLYVSTRCQLTLKYADFARLYTRERMNDRFLNSPLWQDQVGPLFLKVQERMIECCQKGIEHNLLRNDIHPFDMAVALENICDGFLYEWQINPEKVSLESKTEIILKIFFNGVCP